MENFYLVVIVILFVLAASDLIVGVSNDAVNFLNSAIGSKVAAFRTIIIIAAVGVLVGATFSNGMMEVARKGIMNPTMFTFNDIIIIFLAVMITDVLLLDLFNTFGLPTSTTVSVVFELLGASVGMAIVRVRNASEGMAGISQYINSEKSLAIISGILLSVAISFVVGIIVMYVSRIIFSFNFKRSIRYFGALWGGLAITGITYFILIKGAKGSSFISSEQLTWISEHTLAILGICFAGWAVILQLLYWIFKVNVLKVIVLFGTFALAMAFAGNDLVNFIGVPLAGFESFKIFSAQNSLGGTEFTMEALAGAVQTRTGLLLAAGVIMVAALWLSKKARTVTRTELSLGKQDLTYERFASSPIARSLVRMGVQLGNMMWWIVPGKVKSFLASRFDDKTLKKQMKKDKDMSFDLVRASVNLAVASSLIALATSYKLPLSTTYVTFMVAMGTSLADKAWGRESAVYRISGVITVIGGWFFTAFVAFTTALIFALLIHIGGPITIVVLILLALFILYRTHVHHKKREETFKMREREFWADTEITGINVLHKYNDKIAITLAAMGDIYKTAVEALMGEKRKKLNNALKDIKSARKDVKSYKKNAQNLISRLQDTDLADDGEYYFQMLDYLKETSRTILDIAEPAFNHVDNNHEPLYTDDVHELKEFLPSAAKYLNHAHHMIATGKFDDVHKETEVLKDLFESLVKMRKNHLKRFKSGSVSPSVSILYLDLLAESKNLILNVSNMIKTSRAFASGNSSF